MGVVITITGIATVTDDETDGPLSEPKRLARIAKLKHTADCIADYLSADTANLGVSGGDIRLALDASGTGFLVQSTFQASRPLTETELARLVKETTGQWSDGIGESCFNEAADKYQVTIDLLQPGGRKPKVEQVEEGRSVKAKKATAGATKQVEGPSSTIHVGGMVRVVIPDDIYAAMSGPHANKTGLKRSAANGQVCEVVKAPGPDSVRVRTPSGDVFSFPPKWLEPV